MAEKTGLDEAERNRARRFESADTRRAAGLRLAREVLEKQGRVSDETLALAREAGYTEAELMEIVIHVITNLFTNYVNHFAETEVDFPLVEPLQ